MAAARPSFRDARNRNREPEVTGPERVLPLTVFSPGTPILILVAMHHNRIRLPHYGFLLAPHRRSALRNRDFDSPGLGEQLPAQLPKSSNYGLRDLCVVWSEPRDGRPAGRPFASKVHIPFHFAVDDNRCASEVLQNFNHKPVDPAGRSCCVQWPTLGSTVAGISPVAITGHHRSLGADSPEARVSLFDLLGETLAKRVIDRFTTTSRQVGLSAHRLGR
jgi:hypothetical protein